MPNTITLSFLAALIYSVSTNDQFQDPEPELLTTETTNLEFIEPSKAHKEVYPPLQQRQNYQTKNAIEHCIEEDPTFGCKKCEDGYGLGYQSSESTTNPVICRKCDSRVRHCVTCGFYWEAPTNSTPKPQIREGCQNCSAYSYPNDVERNIHGIRIYSQCKPCAMGACLKCNKENICEECRSGYYLKWINKTESSNPARYCLPSDATKNAITWTLITLYVVSCILVYVLCCKDYLKVMKSGVKMGYATQN
jgi:hypothetical protein